MKLGCVVSFFDTVGSPLILGIELIEGLIDGWLLCDGRKLGPSEGFDEGMMLGFDETPVGLLLILGLELIEGFLDG